MCLKASQASSGSIQSRIASQCIAIKILFGRGRGVSVGRTGLGACKTGRLIGGIVGRVVDCSLLKFSETRWPQSAELERGVLRST